MPRMHHGNFDFLAYLNQVHTDIYRDDTTETAAIASDNPLPLPSIPFMPPVPPIIPFPQDTFQTHLLSHIFSFLSPSHSRDASALVSCALTCKQWTVPAQIRLFHSILIRDENSLFKLWEKLTSSPHLPRRVHEIRIRDRTRSQSNPFAAADMKLPTLFIRTPTTLAPILPNAQVLRVENINWRAFWMRNDPPTMKWLSKWLLFPPLQELALTSCSFSSFNEFEQAMMSFPTLGKLSLDTISWGEHPIAMAEALRFQSRRQNITLRALRVGFSCDIHTITMWMLATGSLSTLKRVEFDAGHEASPEVVAPFLSATRDSTEYLRMGCAGMRQSLGTTINVHMNFHAWPHLHTLHLSLLGLQPEKLNWVPISLARALPEIPRPLTLCPTGFCSPRMACSSCQGRVCNIKTIVFDFWLSDIAEMDGIIWDQIILILHRLVDGGQGVQRIVFVQRGQLNVVEVEYIVKKRMGSLQAYVEVRNEWNE